MLVPAVYAVIIYGTICFGPMVGDPANWEGSVLILAIIVAGVHAATLDTGWKTGQQRQ